jgi:hypothetical protein
MKPFDIRGSIQVARRDVFNNLATRIGLVVYKDRDVFVLVIFLLLLVVMISLRFRRILVTTIVPI